MVNQFNVYNTGETWRDLQKISRTFGLNQSAGQFVWTNKTSQLIDELSASIKRLSAELSSRFSITTLNADIDMLTTISKNITSGRTNQNPEMVQLLKRIAFDVMHIDQPIAPHLSASVSLDEIELNENERYIFEQEVPKIKTIFEQLVSQEVSS